MHTHNGILIQFTRRTPSGTQSIHSIDAPGLSKALRSAASEASTGGHINVFTFDDVSGKPVIPCRGTLSQATFLQLHTSDVAALTVAAARQNGVSGMTLLAQTLSSATHSLSFRSANIKNADISALSTELASTCKIVSVAGLYDLAGDAMLSRQEYQVSVATHEHLGVHP
jgi:hypothetical protein